MKMDQIRKFLGKCEKNHLDEKFQGKLIKVVRGILSEGWNKLDFN